MDAFWWTLDLFNLFIALACIAGFFSLMILAAGALTPKEKYLISWICSGLSVIFWLCAGYMTTGHLWDTVAVLFALLTGLMFTAYVKAPKLIPKRS